MRACWAATPAQQCWHRPTRRHAGSTQDILPARRLHGFALCTAMPHCMHRLRHADLLRPAHLTWPILRVSHLVDGFLWGTCTTKAVGCTRKLKPFCKLMCIRCCTLFLRMGGPGGLAALACGALGSGKDAQHAGCPPPPPPHPPTHTPLHLCPTPAATPAAASPLPHQ